MGLLQTLLDYAPLITAAMSATTALIWIVYLNVFLASYRRQRRPSILITSGAGRGMRSHCFVTNLGLEPIFLLDIILDLVQPDGTRVRAVIPERNERWCRDDQADTEDARRATNVGPLHSGEEIDIGRFSTMIDRACAENPQVRADMPIASLEVTVVTITAAGAALCGASRRYRLEDDGDGGSRLRPTTIKAKQLQGFFARRRLTRVLASHLSEET